MAAQTPSPHRFLTRPKNASTEKSNSKDKGSGLRFGVTAPSKAHEVVSSIYHGGGGGQEVQRAVTPARRFVIARGGVGRAGTGDRKDDMGKKRSGEKGEEDKEENRDEEEEVLGARSRVATDAGTREKDRAVRPTSGRKFDRIESIGSLTTSSSPVFDSTFDRPGDGREVLGGSENHEATSEQEDNGKSHGDEDADADADLLFTPPRSKRPRLSPSPRQSKKVTMPSKSRTFSTPQMPALKKFISGLPTSTSKPTSAALTTPVPRFVHPPPTTPNPSKLPSIYPSTTNPTTTPRPYFLLPPSPSKSSSHLHLITPLSTTFSPTRKGQKYIPGGLAATLQSWVVEVGSTAQGPRDGGVVWGREREEGVRKRVRVGDLHLGGRAGATNKSENDSENEVHCHSGGVTFLRGAVDRDQHSELESDTHNASHPQDTPRDADIGIMLAGTGSTRGVHGVKIRPGSVIGIKAPMWDVDVEGRKWVVGVEWVVLE